MVWMASDIEIDRKKMCLRHPVRFYEASEHGLNFKRMNKIQNGQRENREYF